MSSIETRAAAATADERWLLWFAISVFGVLGCLYAIAVTLV